MSFQDDVIRSEARDETSHAVFLRGLYDVTIEVERRADLDPRLIKQAVIERLHANRGLCEDFEKIELLSAQDIQIHASIEINCIEDKERILLDVYRALANHISPAVPCYSLEEWLAAGRSPETIYEGPLLLHGFIDSADLQPRWRVLHRSDMIREIMAIPGVLAVP